MAVAAAPRTRVRSGAGGSEADGRLPRRESAATPRRPPHQQLRMTLWDGVAATNNATPAVAAAATGHLQQPHRNHRQLSVVNGGGA